MLRVWLCLFQQTPLTEVTWTTYVLPHVKLLVEQMVFVVLHTSVLPPFAAVRETKKWSASLTVSQVTVRSLDKQLSSVLRLWGEQGPENTKSVWGQIHPSFLGWFLNWCYTFYLIRKAQADWGGWSTCRPSPPPELCSWRRMWGSWGQRLCSCRRCDCCWLTPSSAERLDWETRTRRPSCWSSPVSQRH